MSQARHQPLPRLPRKGGQGFFRYSLLALTLLATAGLAHGEQPNASAQQLEQLEKRINEVNTWLKEAEDNRSALVRNLRSLEQEIGGINSRLHELKQKQDKLQSELATLDQEARVLRDRLESQRGALSAQLRNAWMQGEAPGLKVLLNEADPQRVARLMTYHEYLSRDAVARLETFKQTLTALQANRAQALEAKGQLAEAQEQVETQREDRKARQAERQAALATLKTDIAARRGELDQLQADRERLEGLIKQVEDAVRTIDLPEESTPFKNLKTKLPWPAQGKVAASYGESMAGGKLRRNGIIIQATSEEPVQAVHYGRVVFADWLRGFGLLLIIDHGDGYMSLYGHNGGLVKGVGDWVSVGETVALAGEGGGSPPGLYFEIRHNGKPVDPNQWLRKR